MAKQPLHAIEKLEQGGPTCSIRMRRSKMRKGVAVIYPELLMNFPVIYFWPDELSADELSAHYRFTSPIDAGPVQFSKGISKA